MKKFVAFCALAASSLGAVASAETLLKCTNRRPGAPQIIVSRDQDGYNLATKPIAPNARSVLVAKFDAAGVTYYGGTIIMHHNMGRSGYIHFYHSTKSANRPEVFLLDDNRFMRGAGLQTDYKCSASRF